MRTSIRSTLRLLGCSVLAAGALVTAKAAETVTVIDFNTNPATTGLYVELGNGAAEWRAGGGLGRGQ